MAQHFEKIKLFSLPDGAIFNTMRVMDKSQLLALSLQSQKCKNLVKSLNLTTDIIKIALGETLEIHCATRNNFVFLKLQFTYSNRRSPISITTEELSQTIEIVYQNDDFHAFPPVQWPNRMSPQKWMTHLKFVFNYSNPPEIGFRPNQKFDLLSIHKAFKDVEDITDFGTSKNVLRVFLPTVKRIDCYSDIFVDQNQVDQSPKTLQHVTIQNLDRLKLFNFRKTDLDDLFSMNCRFFGSLISATIITFKDLNRFLKGWIRGGNPRLEHMSFWFSEMTVSQANVGQVFQGIDHQVLPEEHEQTVKEHLHEYGLNALDRTIKGGYSIRNKHGILSTVKASGGGFLWRLMVFVWN